MIQSSSSSSMADEEQEQEQEQEQEEEEPRKKKKKRVDTSQSKSKSGSEEVAKTMRHFFLVHGPCHGGWVWFKLITLLRSAGHRVTAVDLAGCGTDPTRLEDVRSFEEYVAPLMEALALLPPEEKVIGLGHCLGGYVLSLAMERFSNRISVAVFTNAQMPKHWTSPATTLDEFLQRDHIESLMDCQFSFDQGLENPLKSFMFGPEFMASMLYNCCSPEDATLATLLVRPSALYLEDISNESMLSEEKYGSVNRVYIMSKQNKLYTEDYQRWIVDRNPPKEVKEIEGSDHMIMLSKPQELCQCLLEIAETYV